MKQLKKAKNALFSLLLLLAALAVLAACGSKAVTAADKIELGRKYLSELNYTEAVASFTEAIKLDPDNIQAYMGRAEAYLALGEYDKALADYQFVSKKAEEIPYTRALSYIGQAEVYEQTGQPDQAVSAYGQAKVLLNANDAGKAENISEEDVGAKLVQVLYVHAALCETLKNYNAALEDYNALQKLGENVGAKLNEALSQLGDAAENENDLPDPQEPAAEDTVEEPEEESASKSAPEQEAASESESQKPQEETKQEKPASSPEQPKEEATSSQETASSQTESEKNNWESYSVKVNLGNEGPISKTLTVKYCVGKKEFDVHYADEWRSEIYQINTLNKITYHLSEPLLSAVRMEKDFYGYTVFYVPEGTTVNTTSEWIRSETESGVKKPDEVEKMDSNSAYFYWIEVDKLSSGEEVGELANKDGVFNGKYGSDITVHSGKVYYLLEPTSGGYQSANVAFCIG